TEMAARAIQLWREHEQRWGRQLMFPIGVLWMAADADDTFERGSLPLLRKAGIPYEELSQRDLARRWPQINLEVVRWGVYEPEGDDRYSERNLPVWADHRERFVYGIPGNQGRGFKVADDTRGDEFDPTSGDRTVSADGLKAMRDYVGLRFPGLKNAPLLESRV